MGVPDCSSSGARGVGGVFEVTNSQSWKVLIIANTILTLVALGVFLAYLMSDQSMWSWIFRVFTLIA
ncbi:MAG: hypothetical protein R3330_14280, partial [Saprospiraceae bacterium]|nr:hypothetical protein [Saprospiraceae bacterium]